LPPAGFPRFPDRRAASPPALLDDH